MIRRLSRCQTCGNEIPRDSHEGWPAYLKRKFCNRDCYYAAPPRETLAERFWRDVRKTNDCWEWQGARSDGYGQICHANRHLYAHRVAWELAYGPIPEGPGHHGVCVLHRCDNRPCVRSDHLFLGSPKDNSVDMAQKGRVRAGNTPPKLSANAVQEMRRQFRQGALQRELVERFGVRQAAVSAALTGRTWAWVKPSSASPVMNTPRTASARTRRVFFQGENLTISQWAQRLGVTPHTIRDRLDRGWSIEQTVTTRPACSRSAAGDPRQ
jgi:Autographiviridae endonuclease